MRSWTDRNLATQGWCLTAQQRRELAVGLRFSTGLCLSLVVVALAVGSPVMIFALAGIGVVAGFAPRHPFDLFWNHVLRQVAGGPPLPVSPTRRRHAFKVAAAWLLAVGGLLAAGATAAGLALGALLVAACALVTATNLCLPSELLAWRERRLPGTQAITTK